jgi:hypothetical protein
MKFDSLRTGSRASAMNGSGKTYRHNRLLIWAALPPALVLAASTLSILGSSTPNHTPPPEFDKLGAAAFSARDQP